MPTIPSGQAAVAAGTGTISISPKCGSHAGYCQVSFAASTTGSVVLKGRVNSDHDYVTLATFTAPTDDIVECAILPDMQVAYVTAVSTFSINIWEAI